MFPFPKDYCPQTVAVCSSVVCVQFAGLENVLVSDWFCVQFAGLENVLTAVSDSFPRLRPYKTLMAAILCGGEFLLSLIICTRVRLLSETSMH